MEGMPMIVDLNPIAPESFSCPHGGEGEMTVKIYQDEKRKIMPCRLAPGGVIGMHCHESGEEIAYVLYGTGVAICDGKEEALSTDVCHICPKGSSHSIRNTGLADLVLLTVEEKG